MKKLILMVTVMLISALAADAQSKKFKFVKPNRDVKKEAKKLEKAGWSNLPGEMPIVQQLNVAFSRELEVDDEGFPKWVRATGNATAQMQSAAEMQSLELAKLNLVRVLESQMRSVVQVDQGNNQLDAKSAASVSKAIEVATNKVSKKLTRVMPVVKLIRTVGKSNVEMQVVVLYSYALARQAILDEMKLEIQNEQEDMRAKFEKYLNPELYKQGDIKNSND